jgi:pimeloyl-ACP methyl ester carboxylesterase
LNPTSFSAVETVLSFGPDGRLVGTLASAAPRDGPTAPTLLLFNAGVIPRIGPHRLNVKLARHLAAVGIPSFRFDLSGQGDSGVSTDATDFERQAVRDIREAMDAVQASTGATRFITFGICSGAVLGFAAALDDPRLVGCAMLDPHMYPTWRTHAIRMMRVARHGGLARTGIGWVRRRIARSVPPSHEGRVVTTRVDLGLRTPPVHEFAADIRRLVERRVALTMIFSGTALYHYNYPSQFDDRFAPYGLKGKVEAVHLPDIDHTVTTLAAQQKLIGLLQQWAQRIAQ